MPLSSTECQNLKTSCVAPLLPCHLKTSPPEAHGFHPQNNPPSPSHPIPTQKRDSRRLLRLVTPWAPEFHSKQLHPARRPLLLPSLPCGAGSCLLLTVPAPPSPTPSSLRCPQNHPFNPGPPWCLVRSGSVAYELLLLRDAANSRQTPAEGVLGCSLEHTLCCERWKADGRGGGGGMEIEGEGWGGKWRG